MIALTLAAAALVPQDFGSVTAIQLTEGLRATSAQLVELDGVEGLDLVVATSTHSLDTRRRELHLHHRRPDEPRAFVPEPDQVLELTPDVVAFAVADVHPDAGSEILLFNARGVFIWRPRATEERERVSIALRGEVLWQTPARTSVESWQHGLVDIDGDGWLDLIVPQPHGYRIARQVRSAEEAHFELCGEPLLPEPSGTWGSPPTMAGRLDAAAPFEGGEVRTDGERESRGFGFAAGSLDRPPLVLTLESVPAPLLCDWDADGDLDLLAQDADELLVWSQGTDASFAEAPDVRLPLPVSGRDEERGFDLSYASFASDLDGDERVDSVILAGDKRSKDPRTQVLVFTQKGADPEDLPLYGSEGRPVQVLVLAGLGGFPRLVDVDGDGLDDLAVFSFRPDLLDGLRSASTRKVEIESYVFRNTGGGFDKKPALVTKLAVPIEGGDFRARFPGDATGDGVSEMLVRDAADHLSLHYIRSSDSGWRVEDRLLWELTIDEDADLVLEDARAGVALEFLVIEREQVLHVSFP